MSGPKGRVPKGREGCFTHCESPHFCWQAGCQERERPAEPLGAPVAAGEDGAPLTREALEDAYIRQVAHTDFVRAEYQRRLAAAEQRAANLQDRWDRAPSWIGEIDEKLAVAEQRATEAEADAARYRLRAVRLDNLVCTLRDHLTIGDAALREASAEELDVEIARMRDDAPAGEPGRAG